jgi:outer membrane murein-binding lipoprotein Lpp
MENYNYTTSFSSVIKPLVSEERDRYLALASLKQIGDFIPDIDTDKNVDLLPLAFNACVVNRANKNGDVMDTETALAIYKDFINKPINVEHNRGKVIGVILTAGFSEFGTDTPLTEEDVRERKTPFNITLGGVVWKITNQDLADLIEDSSDPTSESYLKVSASWELGFSDYKIIKVRGPNKNIENGELISDEENIEKLKNNLKSFGGNGKIDDDYVYRLVAGDVVPLGIGFTESPAADVKGVATEKETKENLLIQKNKSSQNTEIIVINEENQVKYTDMKITSLNDITDESLKTMEASVVADFIESELKKKCDEYESKKDKLETAVEESRKDLETLSTEKETLKSDLEELKTKVEEMETEKAAQLAEAKFNERMTSFDEEYQLDDDTRKVIVVQLKAMSSDDEDESFKSWVESSKVLLKRHSKEFIDEQNKISATEEVKEEVKEETKTETTEKVEEAKEEAVASTEAEEVVEEVIENAEEETGKIPNTTEASRPSVMEKYQQAFNLDQFEIKL